MTAAYIKYMYYKRSQHEKDYDDRCRRNSVISLRNGRICGGW